MIRLPVVHPDLEAVVTSTIRGYFPPWITGSPLQVGLVTNREQAAPTGNDLQIVVRHDPGSRRDLVLKDSSLGITIIGANRSKQYDAVKVAELLGAFLESELDRLDQQIVDVEMSSGPTPIAEPGSDALRLYMTFDVVTAGRDPRS